MVYNLFPLSVQQFFSFKKQRTPEVYEIITSNSTCDTIVRQRGICQSILISKIQYIIYVWAYSNSSFSVSIISLKLFNPDSKFSMISFAKISGSGRLSKSVKLLSLNQKISKLVLSLAMISS